jgi:UDP-N-acetylglucosamine 2-epimerase (non-hydrolysing)
MDLYEDVKELAPDPDFSFSEYFSEENRHNTLGTSFVKICKASEAFFSRHRFEWVMVQGDTTTAWALAQMAFYNRIRIVHVEAGLRTFDWDNPYPEELNRTLISQVSHINFAPTKRAYENLIQLGARNVHLVGNTILDAVYYFKASLGLTEKRSNKVLVTLHRRENHPIMGQLLAELQTVAEKNPDLEFVFPMHPNPEVNKHRARLTASNIQVVPPIRYPEMLKLISQALFIISDSGGIQEEATCFNKKVIVMRKKTERTETIELGLGRLAGRHIQKFIAWAREPSPPFHPSPYGDGHAGKRIVQIMNGNLKHPDLNEYTE